MRDEGKTLEAGDKDFVHESDRGRIRMWLAAPTVLVMKYWGYSDDGYMPFIEDVWDVTLARVSGPVRIFADTSQQTGFSHGFRTGMVAWNRRIVGSTDTYCLLVRSRWIAMGIALVRATIGMPARHAEVTTSRDRFESRLAAAVSLSGGGLGVVPGDKSPGAGFDVANGRFAPSSAGDFDDH